MIGNEERNGTDMGVTIKSKEEITILREAGKRAARILDELETLAVPGNTTLDIDDRAMELIEAYELEPMTLGYQPRFADRPYPAATSVSLNDVVVHGIPNEHPIEIADGDLVSIDLVVAYQGMIVDSARTVGAGELSDEASGLIAVTKTALDAGIAAARAGSQVSEIGRAIEGVVPEGYGIIDTFCGHGVGYALHEPPNIPNFYYTGAKEVLEVGMVLAIEPMITSGRPEVIIDRDGYSALTKDGSLGAHMEHTVVVKNNGPAEVLTRA